MQVYTETTDGSSIESKESALVWHYLDADHDFGSFQAKELQGHLERVLSNEPVVVKCGHYIVEVKPQVLYSLRRPNHYHFTAVLVTPQY
jgi:trehalose 6-phosphate synthase/phosphatase